MLGERRSIAIQNNCTPAALNEFPHLLSNVRPRTEITVIAAILSMYYFIALAIVCDEYFVPAVERLCYKLKLSYDVGGATLMAASTSAPELCVHIVGTFITEGDLGIGTIVGSSVFNSLAIVALCGLLTKDGIQLDWWPVTRDLSWYFFAIFMLTVIIMDEKVHWYEALIMVALCGINLTTLISDRRLQHKFRQADRKCCLPCFVPTTDDIPDKLDGIEDDPAKNDTEKPYDFFEYAYLETNYQRVMWLVAWPIHAIYFVTIPNVRRNCTRHFLWSAIVCSMFWISVLSYLVSWMLTVVGYNLYIPDSVMGITFLAAGTSIPEAVSSVLVTRKGYGSMAICNSISSNTMDIFFCLGVPWLVKTVFRLGRAQQNYVSLNSSGLFYVTASLLTTGTLMYVVLVLRNFNLGRNVGIDCMLMYAVYLVLACSIELNVFGMMNKPSCTFQGTKVHCFSCDD